MSTLRAALTAQDPAVLAAAIEVLIEVQDVDSTAALAQIAEDPKNPLPLRIAALGGLTKLAGPGTAGALIKILADDSPPDELTLAALAGVGTLKVESALPAVTRLLAASETEIRAQAIETLAQIRGAAAETEIVHAFADAEPEAGLPRSARPAN